MTFLKKMLGLGGGQPATRIRICQECGMPVAEHKEWCSIYRTRLELEQRQAASSDTES
jgi:hypothetical protein